MLRPQIIWPAAFLLLASITGPPLITIIPPGHAPDERGHVLRADSLLYGQLIGHRETIGGVLSEGVIADSALAAVITVPAHPLLKTPEPVSPVKKWLATMVPWDRRPGFIQCGSIAGYAPLFYLPGALAIAFCKLLGLSPLTAFLGVRLANFCVFLAAGAAALRIAGRGRVLMACTLLLPMSLGLAASCSQDGMLIAAATLAVACLTRQLFWPAVGLLTCIALAKPPYAPLALLLLSTLRRTPQAARRAVAGVALVVLPASFWSLLEGRVAVVTRHDAAAEAGPLWPGPRPALFAGPDIHAQLHVLASHPWAIVWLPLQSIAGQPGELLREAAGILDYLCLNLPAWLYAAWYAALACAIAAECCGRPRATRLRLSEAVLACVAILLSVLAIGMALYLQWTPVGMPWIGGIEGRYVLPLLPVLVLALPRLARPRLEPYLAGVPLCVAAMDAAILPGLATGFYPFR